MNEAPHTILGKLGLVTVTVRDRWACPCGVEVVSYVGDLPVSDYGPWCVHCRTQRGGPWPESGPTPCPCRLCRKLEELRKRDRERKRGARRENTAYAERQRTAKRSPERREARNARRRTPEVREKQASYMRIQRQRPEFKAKDRARAAVKYAIKKGDLVPGTTCEECGKDPGLRSDGKRAIRADHHKGYTEEHFLDVRWVCPDCDGKAEIQRGNTTRGKWRDTE